MKLLVIGSGGREHALCWRLAQCPSVSELFCAPGNPGISALAQCVALPSHQSIVTFCAEQEIGLVVIGPEQPLVEGLADLLRAADIPVFGPSAAAAKLEGSKSFTKKLCDQFHIPTADYETFDNAQEAIRYITQRGAPIVVKADGLAAGKGVVVAMSVEEALEAVNACFSGQFGSAGARVVVEDFMEGEEVSFFALSDGEHVIEFASAQDHKAVGEGDTGPNTGGMGAYSPAPIMTEAMRRTVMDTIITPSIQGMKALGNPFVGVLFAGLMMTATGPKLIEFNCRFGDPETQAMLPRIEGDLALVLLACATGQLKRHALTLSPQSAICVVMASNGYPGAYTKGSPISGLEAAAAVRGVTVFHAGTALDNGRLVAAGGRVLGITAVADSIDKAKTQAYQAVDAIDWPGGFCRRDIGWRAIRRQAS